MFSYESPEGRIERVGVFMRCLAQLEESGNWKRLRSFLRLRGTYILRYGSVDEQAELEQLRKRLYLAEEYERAHGEGSLIKSDHPVTLELTAARANRRSKGKQDGVAYPLYPV